MKKMDAAIKVAGSRLAAGARLTPFVAN